MAKSKRDMDLDVRVGRLETQVETILDGIDRLSKGMSRLAEKIGDSRTTDWKTLFAGSGFLLAIILAFGSSVITPIRSNLANTTRELQLHVLTDGHPLALQMHAVAGVRFDRIEADIRALESRP